MPSSASSSAAKSISAETPAIPVIVSNYWRTLESAWQEHDWSDFNTLIETLQLCWRENRQVFLCGNGGSAANAIHLANDLLYGVDKATGRVRGSVLIFVNDEDIRFLQGEQTPLKDGDELSIVPAFAGG